VFKEIMLNVYAQKLAGPVPEFPTELEQSISAYLKSTPANIDAESATRLDKPYGASSTSGAPTLYAEPLR
jgi:hypothetical protein